MTPYHNSPPGSGPSARSRTLMRLRGLIRKEFLQAFRDPSSLGIAFVMPVVLLLLFGYGVSLDAEHVPLALVVEKPTPDTASFCGAFEQSRYFEPVYLHGIHPALEALAPWRLTLGHVRDPSTAEDIDEVLAIKALLYDEGYKIAGAVKMRRQAKKAASKAKADGAPQLHIQFNGMTEADRLAHLKEELRELLAMVKALKMGQSAPKPAAKEMEGTG